MTTSFDQLIDRSQTQSVRWSSHPKEVIPLWVADMDFACPPCIQDALHQRIEHGIYGYTKASEHLREAIIAYLQRRYQWQILPEWLIFLPSVVTGLYLIPSLFLETYEQALIPSPAYHHFQMGLEQSTRSFVKYHFTAQSGRWAIDFEELETLVTSQTKLLMLCNPHNPGGTVFHKDELEKLGSFAVRNNLMICSDEIHADLILDTDKSHLPIASLTREIGERTITLMSLNKAFNFPGIGLAWAVVPNQAMRQKIQQPLHGLIPSPNLLAYEATLAAISAGQTWHTELLNYLRNNRDYVMQRINRLPGLKTLHLEATYLAWIDASGIDDPYQRMLDAGVALSPGAQFGAPQFLRLNFGTPMSRLKEALDRIELTFK